MPVRPIEIMEKHTYDADKDGIIDLGVIPATLTGKDADTVDGKNPGSASGLATLDVSSKVVQDPASKAQASGIASLDASSKVVQDPATSFAKATSGSYTGDGAADRAIPHALGIIPKIVFIYSDIYYFRIMVGYAYILPNPLNASGASVRTITAPDITNFYVGNAGSYAESANLLNIPHYWVAIGQKI